MNIFGSHSNLTSDLAEILKGIESELDASLSPNNRAMQALGVDRNGFCQRLYSDEAKEIWESLLRSQPEDPDVLHHLAVFHHAYAFDVEVSAEPNKSNDSWEAADTYWRKLCDLEEFWSKIETALPGFYAPEVPKVRARLPFLLLQVHYDIAFDPKTPSQRAKFHVQQAAKVGFSADILSKVRESTYERFTSDLPEEVWGGTETNQDLLVATCRKILRILEIDPECLPALHDVLGIQKRLLIIRSQELFALDDDQSSRQILLKRLSSDSMQWLPYFEVLLANGSALEEDVRENLLLWLRVMGDVRFALNDYHAAMSLYDKGATIARETDPGLKLCQRGATQAHALWARELAEKKSGQAKEECAKALKRPHLSPWCHARLAEAYSLQESFDAAIAVCEAGLAAPFAGDSDDPGEITAFEQTKIYLQKAKADLLEAKAGATERQYLRRAQEAAQKGNTSRAISILNELIVDRGQPSFSLLFLRCQCYALRRDRSNARSDLSACEKLASDSQERDLVSELKQQLKPLLS